MAGVHRVVHGRRGTLRGHVFHLAVALIDRTRQRRRRNGSDQAGNDKGTEEGHRDPKFLPYRCYLQQRLAEEQSPTVKPQRGQPLQWPSRRRPLLPDLRFAGADIRNPLFGIGDPGLPLLLGQAPGGAIGLEFELAWFLQPFAAHA